MKINSFLGDGDRLSSLIKMREEISKEIYRYCLLANIDIENFNHQSFMEQHKNNINSMIIKYYPDLVIYCEKFDIVDRVIRELNDN